MRYHQGAVIEFSTGVQNIFVLLKGGGQTEVDWISFESECC